MHLQIERSELAALVVACTIVVMLYCIYSALSSGTTPVNPGHPLSQVWIDENLNMSGKNITNVGTITSSQYCIGASCINTWSDFLPRSGSLPMTGNLNMSGKNITNAGTITSSQYCIGASCITTWPSGVTDVWVNTTGDTMTGNLNMSGNNITNVGTITSSKYCIGAGCINTWSDFLPRNGSLPMTGNLNMSDNNIVDVNTIYLKNITVLNPDGSIAGGGIYYNCSWISAINKNCTGYCGINASCPSGKTPIAGGCWIAGDGYLHASFIVSNSWRCALREGKDATNLTAYAHCCSVV
ncbi:MAG: hypothetical protein QXP39_00010 [Candidatus Aenigmatarchaeota archaeon]